MGRKSKKELTGFEKAVIERTRTARDTVGINQEKIAEHLGIPRATYANYENDRIMDLELIPEFCRISGVTVEFLLTGKDHYVVAAYNDLGTEDRRLAEKVLGIKHTPKKMAG